MKRFFSVIPTIALIASMLCLAGAALAQTPEDGIIFTDSTIIYTYNTSARYSDSIAQAIQDSILREFELQQERRASECSNTSPTHYYMH